MKKRLFLAIPLSESLLDRLGNALLEGVQGVRRTEKQNLHVTVYFFGDVEESKIAEMSGKIKEVVAATPPFALEFKRIKYAPPNRPPRMIWADFNENNAYNKLVQAIYANTKAYLNPKSAQETDREPHPHITLARLKSPAIAKNLKLEPIPPEAMTALKCQLFVSELTPQGPLYTVINEYRFA
jgi:RNA 2',3'-cyclic 3'-phosphodiesterase